MSNRVALITGGARGIGRALAIALAQQGWEVAVCYRRSVNEAASLMKALRESGVRSRAEQCDVSDAKAAQAWVQKVEEEWGRVDALINCAGLYHRVNFFEETLEGWHEMFDHNLHPLFYLSHAVAPGMRRRKWGRIINFSIANAEQLRGQPFLTAHYIAKVGVLIVTRTLAKTLAPEGITVNCISPGFIASEGVPVEELQNMVSKIPAGYVGAVDDAVAVCRFLLSEEARYVNGANILLSGAWGI
ncbi:SDR family oxidoreductase [candidate division KSB1 bacterium]|nr:SDR family oxidoreductase [candidate division KSB1 bacterium]